MNGAATTRHRNVTIEDESEPGDPPPRRDSPSPSPSQSPVPQQLPSPKARSPRPVSPHAPSPEVIDVDSPSPDSPEYISQLSYQNSLIREATMPILPPDLNDFGIPPSPPGSPDPSLTAKLDKFRQLRQQGIFFNDRLGENRGFRNPKLLERLRGFVGVKDEYASHLPIEIWNPHGFTEDQYFDVLAEKQKKEFDALQVRQMNEQRSSIEFTGSAREARERSAADRIMEGLNSRPDSRPVSRTGGEGDRKRSRYDDRREERRDEKYWRGDRRDDRRDGRRSRERSRERERERDKDRDRDRGKSHRDRDDRGRR